MAIAVSLAFVAEPLLARPVMASWRARKDRYETLVAEKRLMDRYVNELPSLKMRLSLARKKSDNVMGRLPGGKETWGQGNLLEFIEETATGERITLKEIVVTAEPVKANPPPGDGNSTLSASVYASSACVRNRVSLRLESGYRELVHFLTRLDEQDMPLAIRKVIVSAQIDGIPSNWLFSEIELEALTL